MSLVIRRARKLDVDGLVDDFWLATGAMAAAGTDDGNYRLGASNVTVANGAAIA